MRSHKHFSFGTTLHRVLQRFHDSGDQGVTTVEEAVAAVEESWIDAGYRSPQEMEEALGLGKELIFNYASHALSEPEPGNVLFVEKRLRTDLGPFVLLGQIDRINELPDGTLEVIDYKSGRETVRPEEVANDLAMACYQVLVRAHYPDRKAVASIIALRSGHKATAGLSDHEHVEFVRDLIVLGEEILNRDFISLEPAWIPLCRNCEFVPLCSKHPDYSPPADGESGIE